MTYEDLSDLAPEVREWGLSDGEWEQVLIEAKYEVYIERQQAQVERLRRLEQWAVPQSFCYDGVSGLRNEAREKLARFRPGTLGQAQRLAGVTPADVSLIMVALKAGEVE